MSEQRWAVLRAEAGNGWLVVRPSEVCREDDGLLGCWGFDSRHHTWEEAMQEADRMARTEAVTLPRLVPGEWTTAGGFQVIPESPGCGDALEVDELDHDGVYFVIGKEDCEPLALVLLAHARGRANREAIMEEDK